MNFIKRGCLSLQRQKGKTFLLFLLIFIIGNVLAATIAIQQSSENVEKNIKGELGNKAFIDLQPENVDTTDFSFEDYTLAKDTLEEIGQLPYVANYTYPSTYSSQTQKNTKPYRISNTMQGDYFSLGDRNHATLLKGESQSNFPDLEEDYIKITEGRSFTEQEINENKPLMLVSNKLAETNNWQLNDTILYDSVYYEIDADFNTIGEPIFSYQQPFQIIGIYSLTDTLKNTFNTHGFRTNADMDVAAQEDFYNTFYTPYKNVEIFSEEQRKVLGFPKADDLEATYVLRSPADIDAFRQEAEAILGPPWKIRYTTDQYNNIAGGINVLKNLAKKVFFVSILVAIILVTLVVLLFLRDRKQELGIYLALGESRAHVAGQLLFEVVTIALFAITFSVFTGNLVAEGISENILASEIKNEKDSYPYVGLTRKFIDAEDVTAAYELQIQPAYIIALYVVGFLTILAAVVIPLTYLFRLRPRAILL